MKSWTSVLCVKLIGQDGGITNRKKKTFGKSFVSSHLKQFKEEENIQLVLCKFAKLASFSSFHSGTEFQPVNNKDMPLLLNKEIGNAALSN